MEHRAKRAVFGISLGFVCRDGGLGNARWTFRIFGLFFSRFRNRRCYTRYCVHCRIFSISRNIEIDFLPAASLPIVRFYIQTLRHLLFDFIFKRFVIFCSYRRWFFIIGTSEKIRRVRGKLELNDGNYGVDCHHRWELQFVRNFFFFFFFL